MGPMRTQSLGGSSYIVCFVDDYTKKVFTYFLHSKAQVTATFIDFINLVENQTDCKVKVLRTDNGTEYVNQKLSNFLKQKGIVHQLSCPYSPQQNGVAERMNRTLIEKAKCMLFDAKLPKMFWAEAVKMSEYIINRTLSSSHNAIPDELFYNCKVNLSHLRIFGCRVMVHVPATKRGKLDEKSRQMTFVGYDDNTKGFRCYDRETKKMCTSHDVRFHENYRDIPENSPSDENSANIEIFFGDDSEYDSDESDVSDGSNNGSGPSSSAAGGPSATSQSPKTAPPPPPPPQPKTPLVKPPRLEVPPRSTPMTPKKTRSGNVFSNYSNPFNWNANLAIFSDEEFALKCVTEQHRDDPNTVAEIAQRADKQ